MVATVGSRGVLLGVAAWMAHGVAGSPLQGDFGLRDSQPADFDAAALADGTSHTEEYHELAYILRHYCRQPFSCVWLCVCVCTAARTLYMRAHAPLRTLAPKRTTPLGLTQVPALPRDSRVLNLAGEQVRGPAQV